MPKLTDTMEEGTIVRWLKHVGDSVQRGEILAEVETDKADMELEAAAAGVVEEIRVDEGGTAAVGAIIAVIGAGDGRKARPAAKEQAAAESTPREAPAKSAPKPAVAPQPAPAETRAARAEPQPTRVPGAAEAPKVPRAGDAPVHGRVELSKMRLTIAKRMAEAKREVPHFYIGSEIDMGEALRLRESLTATGMSLGVAISVTHMIIKAAAIALQRQPRVNAAWDDGAVLYSETINIGIATAVEDGLLVPVLRECERLSLADIAKRARELNEKAQGGRFGAEEMLGATFSISNMGMLDIDEFSAVINPPQAAILAVGAIKERAVARQGRLAVAKTMRVTLSCDHRVLNGVEGARFLEELKRLLENPVALVMG